MLRIFLTLCSSVLLILCFPLFDFSFLSWIAFVPLFLVIRNKDLRSTIGLSFLAGLCFFMGVFYWINLVTGFTTLHFFIIMVYLGLYFALFGLLLKLTSRKWKLPLIIPAPFLWVSIEYLRAHAGFAALPLGLLGHSQYRNISLLQMASFTGVYGISFIIMLANAAIADLVGYWIDGKKRLESTGFKNPPVLRGGVVLLIILVLWVTGYISLHTAPSGKSISVAVIQGNIPQEKKWDSQYRELIISKHEHLSEVAAESKPQVIVWPEASTPGLVLKDITLYQRMVSMIRRFHTYLLVGSAEYPKFDKAAAKLRRSGNTALFFSPEGKILGQYLKIRLLPFGEYAPLEGIITWPDFIIPRNRINFNVAGTKANLFGLEGTRFGTLICWEIIFPELSRRFVTEGADFLVNISNEAWFGKSAFPYQFLITCVFRAVENRVNLVRATNTGVSCFIDPYGRITGRVTNAGKDIFVEGTLTKQIFLSPPGTFYTRYGDVFAYGCIAFSIALVVWSILKNVKQVNQSGDGSR